MDRPSPVVHTRDSSEGPGETLLVVGGGDRGLGIARSLAGDWDSVAFVDEGAPAESTDIRTIGRRVSDGRSLRAISEDIGDVGTIVAAGSDSHALLVAHLTHVVLAGVSLIVVIDDQWRRSAFEGVDARLVEAPTVLAGEIRTRLPRLQRA